MKVLITGHKGFVGRHFLRALDGHDIVGVDIKDGVDARDFFRTDSTRFDLVIHLAAVVGGRLTIENSPLAVAVDLSIDAELFNWALRTNPTRIVYYSSSAAYPINLQAPDFHAVLAETDIDLNDVMQPDFTYGWAKLTGELLAKYAAEAGQRVHVFRPFSGYGEDQDLDYPFPSLIARGKQRATPFQVWGDGEQVRDFIHIEDVVAATLEAVSQDYPGPLNLGTGRATSFNELADIVMSQAGYSAPIEHVLTAPTGVAYRVADVYEMHKVYTPKITLEKGVRRALRA